MLLFTSTVPGQVKTPKDYDPRLDKAKAYVTEDLMYRHWDHWTTERPQAYIAPLGQGVIDSTKAVINILGDDAGKYELPTEPFGGIEQLCWSPDGKKVAYSCKKVATGKEYAFSTDTEIYLYDVASGKTAVIPMGGGYDTDPVWSPDGSRIAWISMARNGYEADKTRLFVAEVASDMTVSGISELTGGFKYNATNPVWAEDSKNLYFCALTEGLQALYKVSAPLADTEDSAAVPVRITPEDAWYDFGGIFGFVDGKLLTTYDSMEFPTELVAVNEADGSFTQITKENEHILGQLKPFKTEEKWLKTVDGKEMLTWILYPPEFDSTKVYPAIEIFLGGPQGTLRQGWSYRWNYRLMCNQGYIVVLPNRRGTTAFGQDWCEEISGDYIGLNMQDYLTAAIYVLVAVILGSGHFHFPLFAIFTFIIGCINSIYMVAYDSFYPLLITEGNYSKAYSIASVLETMAAFMIPVATFLYNQVGLAPLMIGNGICFFIAATLETRIGAEEAYIQKQKKSSASLMARS